MASLTPTLTEVNAQQKTAHFVVLFNNYDINVLSSTKFSLFSQIRQFLEASVPA